MGITTGATAGGNNQQINATSIENTRGGYFPHFSIIGANLFGGFRPLVIIITHHHYYYHQDLEGKVLIYH